MSTEDTDGRRTTAQDALEEHDDPDKAVDSPQLPVGRIRRFQTTGMARMSLDWQGEDKVMIAQIRERIEDMVVEEFRTAFLVMNELFGLVRDQAVDPVSYEPRTDRHGFPVWAKTPNGDYVESWDRLSSKEVSRFYMLTTARLFEWEQAESDGWGEALIAKSRYRDAFAVGYESAQIAGRPTVDDRKQRGQLLARDAEYFAVYRSWYSRRAEAVVRSMVRVNQRLKDIVTTG